jgi:gluconolactonase
MFLSWGVRLLGAFLLFQIPEDLKIERVASGFTYTEGPLWAREGYLLFSDATQNKIYKLSSGEKPATVREETHGAMGLTLDAQGRLYMCETKGRRVTRLDKKGKLEVVAEAWQGKKFNAPNDVVVRKDGHVYFTDPAFGNQQDTRELDFYGVFHITPKGELGLVAKWKGRPNGIALSPNGRILYVANSDEYSVLAYDVEKDGAVANERVVISKIDGVPGGVRVDEKGNLYVTANGVFVFDSAGRALGKMMTGETPSNLTWGDSDFGTLYVTAKSSVYRIRMDVKGSVQY